MIVSGNNRNLPNFKILQRGIKQRDYNNHLYSRLMLLIVLTYLGDLFFFFFVYLVFCKMDQT